MAYPFLNMVFIGLVATERNHGVQMFMLTPPLTIPTSGFSIGSMVRYFQSPTWSPPSKFNNSGGGTPIRGGGSSPHGSGRPPRRGSKPSFQSGGPLSGSWPPNGDGPPSGGGGGEFLVGGAGVPFDNP
jgi:hypothetical protein